MPLECGHHVLSVPEWDPKWAQSNIYYTRVKVAFGDLMLGPSHIAPGPAKKVRKFNVTNF